MLLVASDVSSFSASGIRTPAPAPFWRPLDSGPGLCRVMTFVPEEEEEEAEDPVLLFVVRRHFLSLLPSSVIEIPLFDFGTLYSNSIEGDSSLNLSAHIQDLHHQTIDHLSTKCKRKLSPMP